MEEVTRRRRGGQTVSRELLIGAALAVVAHEFVAQQHGVDVLLGARRVVLKGSGRGANGNEASMCEYKRNRAERLPVGVVGWLATAMGRRAHQGVVVIESEAARFHLWSVRVKSDVIAFRRTARA